MKVHELIALLQEMPAEADVFYANFYREKPEGLRLAELYDVEPAYYSEIMGCGSGAPWKRSKREHVVVLETT